MRDYGERISSDTLFRRNLLAARFDAIITVALDDSRYLRNYQSEPSYE